MCQEGCLERKGFDRKNILLTGPPGVGKTTVIRRTVEQLVAWSVGGFYTRELRRLGRRVGFQAVTLDGQEGRLAEAGLDSPQKVGRYGVDVGDFERVVLPALTVSRADLVVVDEIGKMECYSTAFQEAVQQLLDGPTPVLGTIGRGGGPFMRSVRVREDVQLLEVTLANRADLPSRLTQVLGALKGLAT